MQAQNSEILTLANLYQSMHRHYRMWYSDQCPHLYQCVRVTLNIETLHHQQGVSKVVGVGNLCVCVCVRHDASYHCLAGLCCSFNDTSNVSASCCIWKCVFIHVLWVCACVCVCADPTQLSASISHSSHTPEPSALHHSPWPCGTLLNPNRFSSLSFFSLHLPGLRGRGEGGLQNHWGLDQLIREGSMCLSSRYWQRDVGGWASARTFESGWEGWRDEWRGEMEGMKQEEMTWGGGEKN